MKVDNNKILFMATGFGLGKSPYIPGTVGTLSGIPLCLIMALTTAAFGHATTTLVVIGFIIFSVIIAQRAVDLLNDKDPKCVVIDEMAGLMVTMIGVKVNLTTLCLAFILFRIFDILKPYPVKTIEETIPGGAGVVLDDVAAGIMANLILRFII